MTTISIYRITNTINSRSYIGKTAHLAPRISKHMTGNGNRDIAQDIQTYGRSAFRYEVLLECAKEDADTMECSFISQYNTLVPHGYNNFFGTVPPADHMDKLRVASVAVTKGRKHNPDRVEKRANALRGRKHDPARVEKRASALRGRKIDPAIVAKSVAARKAKGGYGPRAS